MNSSCSCTFLCKLLSNDAFSCPREHATFIQAPLTLEDVFQNSPHSTKRTHHNISCPSSLASSNCAYLVTYICHCFSCFFLDRTFFSVALSLHYSSTLTAYKILLGFRDLSHFSLLHTTMILIPTFFTWMSVFLFSGICGFSPLSHSSRLSQQHIASYLAKPLLPIMGEHFP